jgi:hypothetical protein
LFECRIITIDRPSRQPGGTFIDRIAIRWPIG